LIRKILPLVLVAAFVLALVPAPQAGASGEGWLTGWSYRKKQTITGTTAGAQTNYQMKMTVHKGTGTDSATDVYLGGNCRDDFGDIRWTTSDGTTLMDYWIESYVSGDYAVFWVEVPSIPASPGTVDVYLYYGKGDATTTSSGSNTWDFFDNCSSLGNWTSISGTWSIESGTIKGVPPGSGHGFLSLNSPPSLVNKRTKLKIKWTKTSNTTAGVWTKYSNDSNYIRNVLSTESEGTGVKNQAVVGGSATTKFHSFAHSANTWYDQEICQYGSYEVDSIGGSVYSFTDSAFNQSWTAFRLAVYSNSSPTLWVDNLAIGKFAYPEPAWGTWGTQEVYSPPTPPYPPTSLQCVSQTNPTRLTTLSPYFSAIHTDNNGDSANKYRIQVSTDSTFATVTHWDSGASGTSMTTTENGARSPNITYSGTTLSRGVTYYWRIKFWDSTGLEGAWSTEVATFRINQLPTAPTTLTLNTPQVGQNLTATASGSTDPDGDSITYYYRFYNQTDGVERKAYSTSNTYTIAAADAHDNIRVFVKAWDGYEFSAERENSIVVANTVPTTSSLKAEGQTNPTRLTTFTPTFSWAYSDADGDTQQRYQIYVGTTSGGYDMWDSGSVSSSSTSAVYAGSALSRGVTYYVQVSTFDGYGWSSWTTGTFRLNQLPGASTPLAQGQTNPTRLTTFTPTLSWTYSDPDGDAQTQRQVQVGTSENGNDMWDSTVATSSSTVVYGGAALSRGVTYYWRVRVYDGYEWGPWLQGGSFRLNSLPAITNLELPRSVQISVTNKGSTPSNIVAVLVKKPDGTLRVFNSSVFLGAFKNGTLTAFATENDKIGVMTQFGNIFWVR